MAAAGAGSGAFGIVSRALGKGGYAKGGEARSEVDGGGTYGRGDWMPAEGYTASFGTQALAGGAALIANAATRSAIEGSNFGDNIMAALPDTIGSIVGNALGRAGTKAIANMDRNAHADQLLDEIAPGGATKEQRQHVKDMLKVGVSDADITAYYGQGLDKAPALVSDAVYRTVGGVPVDQNGNPTGNQFLLTGGATGSGVRIMVLEGKIANLSSGSALSVADAGELARLKGIDPTKPLYVGGGGEEGTGLTNIVRDYADGRDNRVSADDRGNFAAWTQDNYIRDYIEITNALDLPRVLIGHSYGGDAVFDDAAYAAGRGIDVSLLATIDPVDGFHNHTSEQAAWLDRKLGGRWVDVRPLYMKPVRIGVGTSGPHAAAEWTRRHSPRRMSICP